MQATTIVSSFVTDYTKRKHIRDEVTHEKIRKHLNDATDQITDDDIRNIKIWLGGRHIEDMSAELDRFMLKVG